mmetsp:Transcript_54079/g.114861  ORF Transcript_54079/g.114861 Transcript_54079/m.114861 type:complete len:88 (+) Transcript_54079:327-590(+)
MQLVVIYISVYFIIQLTRMVAVQPNKFANTMQTPSRLSRKCTSHAYVCLSSYPDGFEYLNSKIELDLKLFNPDRIDPDLQKRETICS